MPMLQNPSAKYRAFPPIDLPDRQWPGRTITTPPRWLSTDLRDGNQSIIDPMDSVKKNRFFDLLIEIGVKEIEVGFPSAGATEFDFIQNLVRSGKVPNDTMPQVLTQSREDLIRTSFASLDGAHSAIVHLYNAVSPAWRDIVFRMTKDEVRNIAVTGAKIMRDEAAARTDTDWHFQYSPETFSTAELDFSLSVCEAVMEVLQPTPEKPIILNLPATVEASTPNIYADQIEYFCRNLPNRDCAVISLHTHNDRGTGVAAAELGLMAGADRVEGCLFGNGERTGNCCLVTMALNLYTQGIDPGIDLSDIDRVIEVVEFCNELPVHQRHPYGGELVYTAFSGSHQDAIKKGFEARGTQNDDTWRVPYLPVDPADLGRDYEAVIRVNSQSGKGGFAWVLEQDQGLKLPKAMQADFSRHVQSMADGLGRELDASNIWQAFREAYYVQTDAKHFQLVDYDETRAEDGTRIFTGTIAVGGTEQRVSGRGNGLISSVLTTIEDAFGVTLEVRDYTEHALGSGRNARAAAYLECADANGNTIWGCGIDEDVATASVRAVLSAANGANT
ncbi:MAG: 2-isopropylmalate synthase [Pontixanthobacter sp.]